MNFEKTPKDRFIILVTLHNMALCYQKLGALEECAVCLEGCLLNINSSFLAPKFHSEPTRRLKKLKYECKIHMQVCALLSQLHRHKEARAHSKKAVQLSHFLVKDLQRICEYFYNLSLANKKNETYSREVQVSGEHPDSNLRDMLD